MSENVRIIRVVAYDPKWPERYQIEGKAIAAVLAKEIVSTHHIGSTAVPGLVAKPTIDILLEVRDVNDLDRYDAQMEQLEYTPKGEFGIPGRRFYSKGHADRVCHVHAFKTGAAEVLRYIAFRDYLIAHPQIAEEYAELKLRCVRDCDNDIEKYGAMKKDFIKYHETKAMSWIRGQ
jgi:GrpB-like predicted nucleotidyltransferase (UPF0157 family)